MTKREEMLQAVTDLEKDDRFDVERRSPNVFWITGPMGTLVKFNTEASGIILDGVLDKLRTMGYQPKANGTPPAPPVFQEPVPAGPAAPALVSGPVESVETIGPETAQRYLDTIRPLSDGRPGQRNRMDHLVRAYASDMQGGFWRLTPDPLVFDTDGRLINGQHRMAAVVKSGTTQQFKVSRGWPHSTFEVLDKGRKRTAAHTLFARGEINSTLLAGIAALLWRYEEERDITKWSVGRSISEPEVLKIVDESPLLREAVKWVGRTPRFMPRGAMAAARSLVAGAGGATGDRVLEQWEASEGWFTSLVEGAGEQWERGAPAHTLRRYLENKGHGHVTKGERFPPGGFGLYLILKAWNKQTKGESWASVSYRADSVKIPTPIPPNV